MQASHSDPTPPFGAPTDGTADRRYGELPANRKSRRAKAKPKPTDDRPRIGDMFVCRESDISNLILMRGMVAQTLSFGREIPGVADVLGWGLTPLTDSEACRAQFDLQIEILSEPGARAVFFIWQGVAYLYSMGSAAKVDETGDNAFISILVGCLERYRPRRLRVATFSRLVRATEFVGRLYGAVLNNVDLLYVGVMPIDLSKDDGRALWHVFSMVSTMERNLIVSRLVAGMVHKYQRGQWVGSRHNIPPGYVYDKKTQTVRLTTDPHEIESVRQLLVLLADHRLSNRELVARAGLLGLSSAKLRQLHGPDATFADARNPTDAVDTLTRWLETYRTGEVRLVQENTFLGLQHVSGVPLTFQDEHDQYGFPEMFYTWDIPEGGWATDEILHEASMRTGRREATGGQAHAHVGLFTGVTWAELQNIGRWVITGAGGEFYHLLLEARDPSDSRSETNVTAATSVLQAAITVRDSAC